MSSSPFSSLPSSTSRGDGSPAPTRPPDVTPGYMAETLAEATRSVLERRFRVLVLVRDAYDRLTQDAPALNAVVDDLSTMLRLLLAWANATYRRIPWSALMMMAGAVMYFVMPVDLIPDMLGPIGLMDDAAIIATVVQSVREELHRFRAWESGKTLPETTGLRDA